MGLATLTLSLFRWLRRLLALSALLVLIPAYGQNVLPIQPRIVQTLLDLDYFDFGANYVRPNETYPQDATGLLAQAPKGAVYVGVGTERVIIGAYLSGATEVMFADYNVQVVLYNAVHIALLQIATDPTDYIHLRSEAQFSEVKRRAGRSALQSPYLELLKNAKIWQEWRKVYPPGKAIDILVKAAMYDGGEDGPFRGVNIVSDEALFVYASNLAKAGRMQALNIDFNKKVDILTLRKGFEKATRKIGILDLSNAWWNEYILNLDASLQILQEVADPKGLVVITSHLESILGEPVDRFLSREWGYLGFTFEHLASTSGLQAQLMDTKIPGEASPHLPDEHAGKINLNLEMVKCARLLKWRETQ